MKHVLLEQALRDHIPKLGPFQTFFTLIKAFIGITILLFPNGYYNAGWLFGTITIIFISLLVLISTNLLLTVSEKVPGSFSALGEKSMGRPGKIFCDIALGLTQTGFVCTHIVFISQNLNGILDNNFGFTINKWIIGLIFM
jgi:proton-coupled amino acid transporter